MKYFYTYKIQFVDGYYYYGSRQSFINPEEDVYWGSPKTNKEKWFTTMYWKEIIMICEDGIGVISEENKLIGNLYKTDPLCLNAHNNGNFSTFGMKYSVESRKKMSDKKKNGFIPWNKGKRGCFTDECRKRMSNTRRGIVYHSKLNPDIVRKIRKMYEDAPPIMNVNKISKNGKVINYDRAFAKTFCSLFQITEVQLYNILLRRSWADV